MSLRNGSGHWLQPLPTSRSSNSSSSSSPKRVAPPALRKPASAVQTKNTEEKKLPEECTSSTASSTSPRLEVPIKHPLEHSWTLWYFKSGHSKIWEENQMEVTTVGTIEDFWAIINYTKKASELSSHCDYR